MENSIPDADALHVDGGGDHVFVSEAKGDTWAGRGRKGSDRQDPRLSWFEAQVFSSEGSGRFEETNGHDATGNGSGTGSVYKEHASEGHGYLDPKTQALRSTAAATTGHEEKIVGGTKGGYNYPPGFPLH